MAESEQQNDHSRPHTGLILPEHALPDQIHIIPVSNRPFFPAQVHPLVIDAHSWEATILEISKQGRGLVGLCFIDQFDSPESLTQDDFPEYGCIARMVNPVKEGDRIQFVAQGIQRFRITRWINDKPPFYAQVHFPNTIDDRSDEIRAYAMAIINSIKELIPLNPLYNEALKHFLSNFSPNDPSPLTDFAAAITTATGRELQEVLQTVSLPIRMRKVLELLRKELEVAKLQSEISEEVNRKINQRQREFFLKEQLKVIQQELGISKDDRTADIELFKERLETLVVPDPVQSRIEEELQKLSILETGSPEYGVTRNYLDWITSVPWGLYSEDNLDLVQARSVLDRDHDGLDDVKDRIIEFLAVGAYKGDLSGSILCLSGPPGVGKTSIGKSIADALGRKFYRFSVGGMRDEAEIKGHRRTYIGAMPGKIVQAFKEVKVSNPVIMLDEIDKMGASYQGDPASAMLEVLDPEQNSEFLDHYLDVRLDLSKVLFVCTANQLESIPRPLLDRMDVIRLSGYIAAEKLEIAKHHLWKRQLSKAGIDPKKLKISDSALKTLIDGYAREAGVRNLEKQLNRIVRKAVVKLINEPDQKISVGNKDIIEYLGQPIFRNEKPIRGVGVVTGLAWTSMGGATLPVEATLIHSKNRGFKLTGQLGDVMKESAEIAYSFISSNLKKFSSQSGYYDNAFIHLHVPEGATPKDGPSAGITMATALASLARGEKINRPLAMTGELTLTGQVLPIGGVREKLIAARRIGIMELVFPFDNKRDFDELPDYLKEDITAHFVKTYQDVFKIVFT